MTFFPLLGMGLWECIGSRLHQFFQQRATILEQRGTQSQLGGFQIVNALLGPLPAYQVYEGLGFLETFIVVLGRFEAFFLLSSTEDSNWVICSERETNSSARELKSRKFSTCCWTSAAREAGTRWEHFLPFKKH